MIDTTSEGIYDPKDVAVLDPTYLCTSACSGCNNPSVFRSIEDIDGNGLSEGEYISVELSQRIIDQIAELGFRCLSIEGGEPTIDIGRLAEIIRYAKTKGISLVQMDTNASRCRSHQEANEMFGTLKEAGLDIVMISAGFEHNWDRYEGIQFNEHPIPHGNVTLAVYYANEQGIVCEVRLLTRQPLFGECQGMPDRIVYPFKDELILDSCEPTLDYERKGTLIKFYMVQTIPVGKGVKIPRSQVLALDFPMGGCKLYSKDASPSDIRFDLYGKVRACCGSGSRLWLEGDLNHEDISTIVARANSSNRLVGVFTNNDIRDIIRLSFREGLARPNTYHNLCDFCHHEIANPERTQLYFEMLERHRG